MNVSKTKLHGSVNFARCFKGRHKVHFFTIKNSRRHRGRGVLPGNAPEQHRKNPYSQRLFGEYIVYRMTAAWAVDPRAHMLKMSVSHRRNNYVF